MKQGLVRLLYNFCKRFMDMIMCVLVCYPVSIHKSQLLSTGHPISSFYIELKFLIQIFDKCLDKAVKQLNKYLLAVTEPITFGKIYKPE